MDTNTRYVDKERQPLHHHWKRQFLPYFRKIDDIIVLKCFVIVLLLHVCVTPYILIVTYICTK